MFGCQATHHCSKMAQVTSAEPRRARRGGARSRCRPSTVSLPHEKETREPNRTRLSLKLREGKSTMQSHGYFVYTRINICLFAWTLFSCVVIVLFLRDILLQQYVVKFNHRPCYFRNTALSMIENCLWDLYDAFIGFF